MVSGRVIVHGSVAVLRQFASIPPDGTVDHLDLEAVEAGLAGRSG